TAPTTPANLQVTGSTASSVSLGWTASTDNVGVAGYNLYLNGAKVGTSASTSYTYTGLACGASYTVGLEAFDAAGNTSNRSLASGSASTSACPPAGDTTAPSVPGGLAATGSTTSSISVGWSASTDTVGVSGYDVYNGAASVGSTAGTSYIVSGLACGTAYTLAVDAYDAAGNHSAKATVAGTTAACPTSATVFLSPAGSDANACTQAAPCRS